MNTYTVAPLYREHNTIPHDSKLFPTLREAEEYHNTLPNKDEYGVFVITQVHLATASSTDLEDVEFIGGIYVSASHSFEVIYPNKSITKYRSLYNACYDFFTHIPLNTGGRITYKGQPLTGELREYVEHRLDSFDTMTPCTVVNAPYTYQPNAPEFISIAEAARYKRDHMPEGKVYRIDIYKRSINNIGDLNIIKREMSNKPIEF